MPLIRPSSFVNRRSPSMPTFLLCLISFFLFLLWERIVLHRAQRRIPLRIAVTGTRGKSSVVRLLASVLKQSGRTVIAKTTGSQAVILLPDGEQIELDRSVPPSILEQKQLIHRAARLKADCLVSEVMSLRPENHLRRIPSPPQAESRRDHECAPRSHRGHGRNRGPSRFRAQPRHLPPI